MHAIACRQLQSCLQVDELSCDLQVMVDVLAWDGQSDLEIVALLASLGAFRTSGLPGHPCPGVARVVQHAGELVSNPTSSQEEAADLSLLYAGAGSSVQLLQARVSFS